MWPSLSSAVPLLMGLCFSNRSPAADGYVQRLDTSGYITTIIGGGYGYSEGTGSAAL
jgi:hypothetical protein